jgi:hypothetical protein
LYAKQIYHRPGADALHRKRRRKSLPRVDKIREAAARGAQIISLHELFRSEYFAARKIPRCSILPSRFRPGHRQTAQIARSTKPLWSFPFLSAEPPAFTTTLAR